jgi:hypothetical protein
MMSAGRETQEVAMPEEFEFCEMRDSSFWAVDLSGSTMRDVDLTGVRISHAKLVDVDIDAFVDRVVINGVDVTAVVNAGDRWYPLRAMIRSIDPDGVRAAWPALHAAWAATSERARAMGEPAMHASVGGEWSFVQTLRHLVFAMDKWFTVPVLGEGFHPMGLPNSGSKDFPWPGLDPAAAPTAGEALAVRAQRTARFGEYLGSVTAADLERTVDVLENGSATVRDCVWTVFEEEFEHLRYMERDLALLE